MHRSDGSGTTFIFTNYLSKVSADWKSKVGNNTAVEWPVGIGAKGNEGVANNVANTKGSIGYVETAYAKQNNLTTTKMINKDGKAVAPTPEAIMAAAAGADWAQCAGLLHDPDQLGRREVLADRRRHLHPACRSSRRTRPPPAKRSSSSPGPTRTATRWPRSLDYIPMPDSVVKHDRGQVEEGDQGRSGKPIF